jgi:hypothetical protein
MNDIPAKHYPGKAIFRFLKNTEKLAKGEHTDAEDDGGRQALARILTELGIDGSLRGGSNTSDQAEEGGENNVIKDSSHCCM